MTERKEYTPEEKAEFVANNMKIMFWGNRELITKFDQLVKEKGISRKDAILKLMQKFVDKNSK